MNKQTIMLTIMALFCSMQMVQAYDARCTPAYPIYYQGQCMTETQFKRNYPEAASFLNAVQNYVGKSSTPQERAKQEAQLRAEEAQTAAYIKANIPNSLLIKQALLNLNKESSKLIAKSNAGIDVSKDLELIDFKINKLQELSDNAGSLEEDLLSSKGNLKNGTLTQAEYEVIKNKLVAKDAEFAIPYQKIISVTPQNLADAKIAEEKSRAEQEAKAQKEAKKQERMQAGRNLLDYGSGFIPSSVNNYVQQGANVFTILGK